MWCSAIGCIVTLTLRMLVAPLAATAQQPAHLPTVGWLDEGNWTDGRWAMWKGSTLSSRVAMRKAISTGCRGSRPSWSGSRST